MLLLMVPLGFGFLKLRDYLDNRPIHWIPYSRAALDHELRQGRTVLISFGADWDPTTVLTERLALETPEVRRWVRSRGVVAMRADWTEPSKEIKTALETIGQKAIPVVAVYPAATPDDPIVLSGMMSKVQVLSALERANRKRSN